MRKKTGFTTIELVIVIAIIGILAGILIPVFSNVVDNARQTEALQNAKNAYTNYAVEHLTDSLSADMIYVQENNRVIVINQGHPVNVMYTSQADALKALCDDPATAADESQNYQLAATDDAKLFLVAAK